MTDHDTLDGLLVRCLALTVAIALAFALIIVVDHRIDRLEALHVEELRDD